MSKSSYFEIIIVGGGHAGLEAANICDQFQFKTGLISMPGVPIASTPCNPAVGGVGKGQVVREIDQLGGVIGKLADESGIQYRILNESKGFAVRSTRVQVDKDLYSKNAQKHLETLSNVQLISETVEGIEKIDDSFIIRTNLNEYKSKKLIITTGTFLAGKLHCGSEMNPGGRIDVSSSVGMNDLFPLIETLPRRFKTGTPPRLKKDSIKTESMIEQKSDDQTSNFHWSYRTNGRLIKQLSCFITHTNESTLDIIRKNKEKSPMFNGQIQGIGPRYCPSIEDKAFRYEDRNRHHVFVEPEGHSCSTVYPNGVSTSLPKEIQESFIRTIEGLESAEIEIHGYAVEYDVVNTTKLSLGLEYRDIAGLYFAGQVNGTSGYEEAAGQGLIAGINACFSLCDRELFILNRAHSYIGVMIDDLVSQTRDEPYRLFTARSENRLFLREDNTVIRMALYREMLGLNYRLDQYQADYLKQYDVLSDLIENYIFKASEHKVYFEEQGYKDFNGGGVKFKDILRIVSHDPINVLRGTLNREGLAFDEEVIKTAAIEAFYSGYIARNDLQFERSRRMDHKPIQAFELLGSSNISFECKSRIKEVMPETFGQLKRLEGIRPATLVFVASQL